MHYPEFFKTIPSIKLADPLADFLGALDEGIVEFTYLDAVKSAGHSCPTIAGAYLLAYKGLEALYPDGLPLRGGIKVELKESITEGVTGVIANVFTQITGATKESGFKGINGQFVRKSLLDFDADIRGIVRFTRLDTGKSVDMVYNPVVPPDANQMPLLQKIMSNAASENDKLEFKRLWQERVKKIIVDHFDDPKVIAFV
ncbi:MAG: hypothetical protein JW857_11165 [Bacteroidales bacterium]|nr:hypothetical protein [Bacteroidales bacterium]